MIRHCSRLSWLSAFAALLGIAAFVSHECGARDTNGLLAQRTGARDRGGLRGGAYGPVMPVLPGGRSLRVALWTTGLPGEAELYDDIAREFERKVPEAQVVQAKGTWGEDTQKVIFYELTAQRGPADIVLLRDAWLPEVADELLSLDAALGTTVRKGYSEAALAACSVDGSLRGLPFCARTKCLYYRPALLRKLHLKPPRTWDELPGVAQKLATEPGVWGFGLPAAPSPDSAELLLLILWAAGGELVDDEGRLVVGRELLEAVKLCTDLVHVAHATQPQACLWTQDALDKKFLAGQLGMLIAEPALARHLAMRKPKLDYAVAPLPKWRTQATRLSVDCLAVSARSPQPGLALQFLRHATQDRLAARMCRVGLLPAKASVGRDPALAVFLASLQYARALPAQLWPEAWPYLANVLVETLMGRKSPEAALVDLLPPDIPSVVLLQQPTPEPEEETPESTAGEP